MPTLAYDIDAVSYAGPLTGRVLLGRRLSHGVVLADPGVSRLHAWVDPTPGGTWAITDAGSKTGTFVNDQRVTAAGHDLRDGDVIRVGSTRVTFGAAADLPTGAEPVVLTPPPGDHVRTSGVLFDCACGAPIWVGNNLVGKRGRCQHCRRQIVVPAPDSLRAGTLAPPPPRTTVPTTTPATVPIEDERPAVARRPQCGVCHAAIATAERLTTCPECDTTYHGECWDENYGCSTYGCGHVNALDPSAPRAVAPPADVDVAPADDAEPSSPLDDLVADDAPADGGEAMGEDSADAPPRTPWEWVAVLGAVLSSAVGAVSFGLPAAVMAVVAVAMVVRRRPGTRVALLVVAVLVAGVGTVAGLALSDYLWLHGAHLHRFAH